MPSRQSVDGEAPKNLPARHVANAVINSKVALSIALAVMSASPGGGKNFLPRPRRPPPPVRMFIRDAAKLTDVGPRWPTEPAGAVAIIGSDRTGAMRFASTWTNV